MNRHAIAVMALLLGGCSDKAGPGAFQIQRDLKTDSRTTTGQPGNGLPSFDDTMPRVTVTGDDKELAHALELALAKSPRAQKGAVTVALTSSPAHPGANGTLTVSMQVSAAFAHPPQVSQLEATIAGTIRYRNRSVDDLGRELAQSVIKYLDGEKLPATIGPPSTKVAKATAIAVGPPTCSLHEDGTVRCWERDRKSPSPLPALTGSTSIESGNNYGLCGVRANGTVYCVDAWDNTSNLEARDVCGVEHAKSVSVGQQSACAVLADGHVRCWGARPEWFAPCGQKAAVEVAGVTAATAIHTGPFRGCALTTSGTVQCWDLCDKNCKSGIVGEVDTAPVASAVKGLANVKAKAIVVGFDECASSGDTKVHCLEHDTKKPYEATMPEPVTKLVYGDDGTCALGAGGHVFCWRPADKQPTTVAGIADAIDVGADITGMCAVTKAGDVLCWGGMGNEAPKPIDFRY